GVILSQIFRGFARGLEGVDVLTPSAFANALKQGAETAYKAMMKPKEGTILTVSRVIAEDAARQARKDPDDMLAMLDEVMRSGEAILIRTPEMLPALKQAGVVDAGGQGLLTIYAGYRAILRGERIEDAAVEAAAGSPFAFEDDHGALDEIHFAYCTEFLIENMKAVITDHDIGIFRRRLARIGDCVVVVGDFSLVKVHVHTNDPGKVLQYGLALGELTGMKIENMLEQRRERLAMQGGEAKDQPVADYGMIAVSVGDGFSKIFKELAVDGIVEGGQTMNPSIDDLLGAIEKVRARTVFVFPNNTNIILAAQQAAELAGKQVLVIPTKNMAMGIGGALAFQPDLLPEENAQRMTEAANRIKSGQITFAIRDSVYDDKSIHEGDIIGIYNGKIELVGDDVRKVALRLMEVMVEDSDDLITVYYGADTPRTDAEILTGEIAAMFEDREVEVHYGGQPLYYYLFSVE
ncbi:MAG: DAK2 domain-containing protein, partial [Clostridia bacterium]|nr:DAK2 domain-containing protein [Clostridia bacterium]